MSELNRQPPDKDNGGGELDQAVDPEGGEDKTVGRNAGADGDHRFDRHPGERDVFKAERLLDQRRSIGSCR